MRTPRLDRAFFPLLAVACLLVLGGSVWTLVQVGAALRERQGTLSTVSTSVWTALAAACLAGGALWLLAAALRGRSVSRGT